jgi:hypothetical protein
VLVTDRPSTGALSIHAALVPRTDNILMWARLQAPGIAYDPGMEVTPGQGEVSSLFNYVTGQTARSFIYTMSYCYY